MIDFEKLVSESSIIILKINRNLTIEYINPHGIEFLGNHSESPIGKQLFDTPFFEENWLGIDQTIDFQKTFDWGGSAYTLITIYENKDGERFYLNWNNKKIFDSDNQFQELVCYITDITPFMLTETALLESEERYRATFEVAPLGITQLNLDGTYIRANRRFCSMLGYSEEEIKKLSFQQITHPDDLPQNLEYVEQLSKGSISNFSMDKRYYHKTGKIVWVTITLSLVRDEDAQPFYYIAIVRDISLQRQIEEELRKSQERFKLLFNKSNDAIFVSRYQGKIFEVNDIACDKLGYTRDEFLNLSLESISNIAELNNKNNIYKEIMMRQMSVFELDLFTKSGDSIPVEANLHTFLLDGHLTVLSVMRDISERRKANLEREMLIEKLETANFELKQLSQMKDDFLAIASHDLRSPFNAILGFTELLIRSDEISDKNKQFIGLIKKNAEIQLTYIHDLLDIVRLETGKIEMHPVEIHYGEVIQDCIETMKVLAIEKNIHIRCEIADNISMLTLDHPKIVQVLNNLITNAIKFTHPGGQVIIRAFINENSEMETHIQDSGIGIRKAQIKHLFNRYKQFRTVGTKGEAGTGLGLAICKNLIELHGGKISVSSIENQGSDFYFTIPIK